MFLSIGSNVNFEIPLANIGDVADKIADAVLELQKPEIDLSKTDPAWSILVGEEISQESIYANKLIGVALQTFETDMQTPGNWDWYPARSSDEKAWKFLREFVIEKYKEDAKCFEKYQTWRTQPYARGAMSNLAIKRNPENFPASWTDFLASSANGKPVQSNKVQLDDDGIPVNWR